MRFLLLLLIPYGTLVFGQINRLQLDEEILTFMQLHENDDTASIAIGSVGNGRLEHGKLMPYKGNNFIYFDRESYLEGRAFLHGDVRATLIKMYDSLHTAIPNRYFTLMECSHQDGGELFPHKTHQNGLSVDFMMPLRRNGKAFYELDTLGAKHYALNFDDNGNYTNDPSVSIDFNLVAFQILLMDKLAKERGMHVQKVIVKIELKDELFESEYGKILKESDIYIVQGLTPLINALHDDHFHIDFGFVFPSTPAAKPQKD